VKIDDLLEPLLEPELVFQLNEDLSSDVSYTEIIQKTSIHLGAEIPDSRYKDWRSEEHTSELQSRFDLVCRLLLEKKKIQKQTETDQNTADNKTSSAMYNIRRPRGRRRA